MVTIAYAHDGTSVYDLLFLNNLVKENIVYFLTFNHDPEFVPSKTRIMRIPRPFYLSVTSSVEGILMYAFCLLRGFLFRLCLKRNKPDIVLGCLATKYGFYSALSGFKPFVLIVWATDILVAPKRFFFFRFMAKFALKKADAVIVDSEVVRDAAIQLGCSSAKILKFPRFDPQSVNVKSSSSEIRKKLGWLDNPIVISVRRHNPIYGVEYLIEAIPHVCRNLPETRFLILGEGQLTLKFKRRVKELNIEQHVKFVGNVSREGAITYMNAADVYVSTSLSDGTSSSLLEAMTLQVPLVVTKIPGNMEWIKDGWNGYLVPTKDPQSLAEKIILLIHDKKLGRKMAENAHRTIETKLDWVKSSGALNSLILKLINVNNE